MTWKALAIGVIAVIAALMVAPAGTTPVLSNFTGLQQVAYDSTPYGSEALKPGIVIAADTANDRIVVGRAKSAALSPLVASGAGSDFNLRRPMGVAPLYSAVSSTSDRTLAGVVIADTGNNAIKYAKVVKNTDDGLYALAPSTPEHPAVVTLLSASEPGYIHISYAAGNRNAMLYIPEASAHCITRSQLDARFRTKHAVIGNCAAEQPGDTDGPVATAKINAPFAVSTTADGEALFFVDRGNNDIKMAWPLSDLSRAVVSTLVVRQTSLGADRVPAGILVQPLHGTSYETGPLVLVSWPQLGSITEYRIRPANIDEVTGKLGPGPLNVTITAGKQFMAAAPYGLDIGFDGTMYFASNLTGTVEAECCASRFTAATVSDRYVLQNRVVSQLGTVSTAAPGASETPRPFPATPPPVPRPSESNRSGSGTAIAVLVIIGVIGGAIGAAYLYNQRQRAAGSITSGDDGTGAGGREGAEVDYGEDDGEQADLEMRPVPVAAVAVPPPGHETVPVPAAKAQPAELYASTSPPPATHNGAPPTVNGNNRTPARGFSAESHSGVVVPAAPSPSQAASLQRDMDGVTIEYDGEGGPGDHEV